MSEIELNGWSIRQHWGACPILVADTVKNHPHIGTGPYIRSTMIIWMDVERRVAMTLNTLYHLAEPAEDVESNPDIQKLIAELHPDNVPAEIRAAHNQREPWPFTNFDNDTVLEWSRERWKDYPVLVPYETPWI